MKHLFSTFCLLVALMMPAVAVSQGLSTGEYSYNSDGSIAMTGQSVSDHLFVRNTYDDQGVARPYDNVVTFKSGTPQKVWFWLDDDEIYNNASVQALTPISCDEAGNIQYNEITYNSFQVDIYLPDGFELTSGKNMYGRTARFDWGERMPYASSIVTNNKGNVVIDGKDYTRYRVLLTNMNGYGCHLSGNDENQYQEHGALKKNDGPVFALFIKNNNQNEEEGRMDDMILANQEFSVRECIASGWTPNQSRFFHGTGGNFEEPCFRLYTRVALYGSQGIDPASFIVGDIDGDGEVDIADVVALITRILDSDFAGLDLEMMDFTGEGIIDVADVIVLIDLVLLDV